MRYLKRINLLFFTSFTLFGPALAYCQGNRQESAQELNEAGVALVLEGKKAQGLEKIVKACEADPQNTTALYNQAGILMTEGKFSEAIQILNRTIEIEPKDLAFKNRLAEAHIGMGDLPQGIKVYEQILALNSNSTKVLQRLGTLHASQGNMERAEYLLRSAYAQDPSDLSTIKNLGTVLFARKDYQEMLNFLTTAKQQSSSADIEMLISVAHDALGNPDSAVASYQQAKKLGFTPPQIEITPINQ
ncbi:tetratricopeptide repeat protein [bacterium]|nr:tetratricopeptide repeat protein [bacterium]